MLLQIQFMPSCRGENGGKTVSVAKFEDEKNSGPREDVHPAAVQTHFQWMIVQQEGGERSDMAN